MKTKLTTLLIYCHRIFYGLIYFSMKYLRTDNILNTIYFIGYILSSTLLIFSIFNELNIIYINSDTMNYFNELDCPKELIENNEIKDKNLLSDNNIISKFLNLFNGHSVITNYELPIELKNHYYTKNPSFCGLNETQLIDSYYKPDRLYNIYKYRYECAVYIQKITFYDDIFSDVLKICKESIKV